MASPGNGRPRQVSLGLSITGDAAFGWRAHIFRPQTMVTPSQCQLSTHGRFGYGFGPLVLAEGFY